MSDSDDNINREIDINIPVLARVEGEGALELFIKNAQVEKLNLRIFEPPRLFEKFLEGRSYQEVPDMVARICGICPVAYQMSAVHAIESAFGVEVSPWIRAMRRVIYCGEWLESHSLHLHLLAAPDFLGFNNVAEMAKKHPDIVNRGLMLQKIGNDLIRLLGGRSIHPIGVKVGGFFHAPKQSDVDDIRGRLQQALGEAADLVHWCAQLDLPTIQQNFECVALQHTTEYAINEGRMVSTQGLDIIANEFEDHFKEFQVPYSTALHCLHADKPYLVGPLARLNLNAHLLPPAIQTLIADAGFKLPSFNSFHSITARAVEIYYALYEAERILAEYVQPQSPTVHVTPKAGVGYASTEAPRGTLWHRYELDEKGLIISARIVPPTSQNQARIEEDLRLALTPEILSQDDAAIRLFCEKIIRNYDPCISCATHFLDLRIKRG